MYFCCLSIDKRERSWYDIVEIRNSLRRFDWLNGVILEAPINQLNLNIMKILIIEDKANHLTTAEQFAKESGHEVTIVTSYKDAEKILCGDRDYGFKQIQTCQYDVVLTDLFLPVSQEGQANKVIRDEIPYGALFVLWALRTGVKKIALLTDGDHHSDPFIWAMDPLGVYGKPFFIGDVKLFFSSRDFVYSKLIMKQNEFTVPDNDPRIGCKAWDVLLNKLLAE